MARKSKRKGVLDWWQTVLDETKDLVDDSLDRPGMTMTMTTTWPRRSAT